jgi:SET domain-containing protein
LDRVLFKSNKIGIKKSPIHGWGVFALEDIEIGDTIEECVYVPMDTYKDDDIMTFYSYPYPKLFGEIKDSNKKIDKLISVIVLGYGSLYNHSTSPNVDYMTNTELGLFEFISIKKITKGEELFIKYKNTTFIKNKDED